MCETIFFAVAGDAKLETWVGQFGRPTGSATMKRFVVTSRLNFETFSAPRDLFALPEMLNHAGTEKDGVIAQRRDKGQPIRIRLGDKREEEKRGVGPRDPFYF